MKHFLLPLFGAVATFTLFAPAVAFAPDLILFNGQVVTVDAENSVVEAVAIENGRLTAVGRSRQIRRLAGRHTRVVDLRGHTAIPGLIDSHIHAIRDGLTYTQKIDWANVHSLPEALGTLRTAAEATPPGTWIVVAGAWDLHQFSEQRLPTSAELDAVSSNHPIYVQHQFSTAVMNRRAVDFLRLTRESLATIARGLPVEAEIDARGRPTGVVFGHGYGTTLARLIAPAFLMDFERQVASTEAYFGVLARVGLTGIIDQGDVFDDQYRPLLTLWSRRGLPIRVRYNIIPYGATPGRAATASTQTLEQITQLLPPRGGDGHLRFLGFGELLDFGLFDGFLNIDEPIRITESARSLVYARARWAAANGYSVNIHATHDRTVRELLDIFERVNREHPITSLRWKIEHAEDLSVDSLRRMRVLGLGYSVQDRMFFGGDRYLVTRGSDVVRRSPPVVTAMRQGITVSGGSDGAVIAPYSPFVGLEWLITGRTASGAQTRGPEELPSRLEALRVYTINGAWGSFEEGERGSVEVGKLADLVVLDRDYLTVPAEDISEIRPLMTVVGGQVVFARAPFASAASY